MKILTGVLFIAAAMSVNAQVYRCGNTYSNVPCAGGKEVDVSSAVESHGGSSVREIYLCKDHSGQLYWQSNRCAVDGRFLERVARVPRDLPWDSQVEIARGQHQRARDLVPSSAASAYSVPNNAQSNKAECQAIEERINWLDSLGRAGGGGYSMDWIREQRRLVRDKQFRLKC